MQGACPGLQVSQLALPAPHLALQLRNALSRAVQALIQLTQSQLMGGAQLAYPSLQSSGFYSIGTGDNQHLQLAPRTGNRLGRHGREFSRSYLHLNVS